MSKQHDYIRFNTRPPKKSPPPDSFTDLRYDSDGGRFVFEDAEGGETAVGEAGSFVFDPAITGLTGGGATKLDGITTVGVAVGRMQLLRTVSKVYFYELVAGTSAENFPIIIRPGDYAAATNEKYWALQGAYLNALEANSLNVLGTMSHEAIRATTVNALADAATITWVVEDNGNYCTLTIGGNRTLGAPEMDPEVQAANLVLQITQDGTGNRTLAYAAAIKFAGGSPPVLSTAAGAVDVLTLTTFDGGATWRGSLAKAFA